MDTKVNQRSALSFFVLIIFAIAATLFILKKANEAVGELRGLVGQEVYLKSSIEKIEN